MDNGKPSPPKRDDELYTQLFKLTEHVGALGGRIVELRDVVRTLPCRDKSGIIPASCSAPAGRPVKPPTNPGLPHITQQDLDNTAKIAVQRAEEIAEEAAVEATRRTFEERLVALEETKQKHAVQRRENVRGWIGVIREAAMIVVAVLTGAGVTTYARCNVAPTAAHYSAPQPALMKDAARPLR